MKQNIVAIVFDFDETLGPDSTNGLLASLGVDVKEFWAKTDSMHQKGWDPMPAYLHEMIHYSNSPTNQTKITKEILRQWGERTPLYPGVEEIFPHLQSVVKAEDNIKLEFYVISSGIEDIIHYTPIAKYFKDIWACSFAFDEQECIYFPKRIVSFTDKTRYLFQIAKGLVESDNRQNPFEVNRKFPKEDLRIPMNQMIFVGDGYTDVPCFSLIKKCGGIPIAVCDPEDRKKRAKAWGFLENGRVKHWAVGNYQESSTLRASLTVSLESICKNIAVRNSTI
jgi:phosphoserine phosphatase